MCSFVSILKKVNFSDFKPNSPLCDDSSVCWK